MNVNGKRGGPIRHSLCSSNGFVQVYHTFVSVAGFIFESGVTV